jgi:DNA-binding MarR family transcriptional regulator
METWKPAGELDELALWRQLSRLMGQVNSAAGRRLARGHGISMGELLLLLTLSERQDGTLRISELVSRLGVNQPAVSRMAARLEEAEWLERRSAADDRRGVDVSITEAGRQVAEAAGRTLRKALTETLDAAAVSESTASLVARLRYAPAMPVD